VAGIKSLPIPAATSSSTRFRGSFTTNRSFTSMAKIFPIRLQRRLSERPAGASCSSPPYVALLRSSIVSTTPIHRSSDIAHLFLARTRADVPDGESLMSTPSPVSQSRISSAAA
jgi:hypothetical protein